MNYWKILSAVIAVLFFGIEIVSGQTITGFSPAFGTNLQQNIIITGTGFSPGTLTVKFNNNQQATATATAATQINARVPAGAITGPVSVKVGAGPETFSPMDFIVISQAPYITNFPSTAAVGASITIKGVHFTGATAVRFNGLLATTHSVTSDTQLQATVPVNVTTGPITITTSKGTGTSSVPFYVVPAISSFSPSSAGAGTNVVILGKSFNDATSVRINGLSVPSYTVNSPSNISFTVPTNASSGPISVFAPAGGVATSSNFLVLPTILSFSPTFGKPGTNVTITGLNFLGSPSVRFNNNQLAGIVGTATATQIVVTVPSQATSGPLSVSTTSGTAVTVSNFFLPPTVAGFVPSIGAPGTNVTITGVNFTNATEVSFNGASASFGVVNNTTITSTVPVDAISGPISVTAPGGTGTSPGHFLVKPSVSGFSPMSGVAGVSVTITGGSFTNASEVLFNGASTTNFTVLNNTQITAIVPAGATTGPISVITPAGTGVSAENFVVDALVLSIKLLTNNAVQISWTTNATGFSLQANTNLNSLTNWVAVTNTPFVFNGKNTVTNSVTNSATFYRLKN